MQVREYVPPQYFKFPEYFIEYTFRAKDNMNNTTTVLFKALADWLNNDPMNEMQSAFNKP